MNYKLFVFVQFSCSGLAFHLREVSLLSLVLIFCQFTEVSEVIRVCCLQSFSINYWSYLRFIFLRKLLYTFFNWENLLLKKLLFGFQFTNFEIVYNLLQLLLQAWLNHFLFLLFLFLTLPSVCILLSRRTFLAVFIKFYSVLFICNLSKSSHLIRCNFFSSA